jgi:hypothetical protein
MSGFYLFLDSSPCLGSIFFSMSGFYLFLILLHLWILSIPGFFSISGFYLFLDSSPCLGSIYSWILLHLWILSIPGFFSMSGFYLFLDSSLCLGSIFFSMSDSFLFLVFYRAFDRVSCMRMLIFAPIEVL